MHGWSPGLLPDHASAAFVSPAERHVIGSFADGCGGFSRDPHLSLLATPTGQAAHEVSSFDLRLQVWFVGCDLYRRSRQYVLWKRVCACLYSPTWAAMFAV